MELKDLINHKDLEFKYMMLSRFKMDVKYYNGYGNKNAKVLWASTPEKHAHYMVELWKSLEVKPEWLTLEQLKEFHLVLTGKELTEIK